MSKELLYEPKKLKEANKNIEEYLQEKKKEDGGFFATIIKKLFGN